MGGDRGLPMVPWDVFTMHKDGGGLDLIDVETQNNILDTKWVIRCLEGSFPWKFLCGIDFYWNPMLERLEGNLVFVISSVSLIILKLQGISSSEVFGLHGTRWHFFFIGICLEIEWVGIRQKAYSRLEVRRYLYLLLGSFISRRFTKNRFYFGGIYRNSSRIHGKIGEPWTMNSGRPFS